MTDAPLPPIEDEPPYSIEFVAHLHGGCYTSDDTVRLLWAVLADLDGARMLNALTLAQLGLRLYGS